MPYAHDESGRYYSERETYPRRRARTSTESRAYADGRWTYQRGIMSADDVMERPPYPAGGPLMTAFWDGWHDAQDGQREADALHSEGGDVSDMEPAHGL